MEGLDLLIHGLPILTAEAEQPLIADGVMGIRGGRIVLLAEAATMGSLPPAERVIDGRGLLATPGFVNVHTHTILTMVRGVAEDMGFAPAYTPGVPHGHDVRPEEAIALARLGALEALLFGSTLINDSYVHTDLTLPAMGELGLRVTACGRIHDVDFSRVADGIWEHDPAIGERTLGEALALAERFHGAENGRLGVQLAAHAPDTCSRGFLAEIREARDRTGLRVTTHLSQSRVEVERILARDGMTPPCLLEELGLLDDRLIAAHCIHMDDADIQRVGRAGIHVAHIPKGNATGATMAPTPRLRAAGAKLTLATDNMHADMVEVMRWGLMVGRLQDGQVGEHWQPEHLFQAATLDGARAMGLAEEIGSLRVGKKADVVLFDLRRPHLIPHVDPLGTLVHTGQGRDVSMVIVDGEIIVEEGRATRVDQDRILQEADAAARALWDRARA